MGFNNWAWNQRLTVEVESNGKAYSGSSVVHVLWWPNFFSGDGASWLSEIDREALVVDLGQDGKAVALLRYEGQSEYTANLATRVIFNTDERVWGSDAFRKVLDTTQPLLVPPKLYPVVILFRDVEGRSTVERVTELVSGHGVKITRVTLEITKDPISRVPIESLLPCITSGRRCVERRPNLPNSDPMADITNGSFLERL